MGVVPKFLCFNLPYTNQNDSKAIRRRLLRSAVRKRTNEKFKIKQDLEEQSKVIKKVVTSIEWAVIERSILKNVEKRRTTIVKTHQKKLKNLSKNFTLPFTSNEVITNLSNYKLSHMENDLLKYGLSYAIPPKFLSKTDVFTTFEKMNRYLSTELKSADDTETLKAELSKLANSYYSNYKPSQQTLKKHGILKRLRDNKDLVITRPDKGNGVVIMNRKDYNKSMYDILKDKNKFRKIDKDPTLTKEGQLQRFIRKLKKEEVFNDKTYDCIYPVGSQPSRLYGTPKLHKSFSDVPPLRPIVSSINSFNYNLAKYLSNLLQPHIPSEHSTEDTFTFIKELEEVREYDNFLVSFDVCSLFTNIPLNETIELALDYIFLNNKDIKISRKILKKLFELATSETHFYFNGDIYEQIDGVAMGSPLAPILANLFMGHHEQEWLRHENASIVKFYKRYVDDIFCIFKTPEDADKFLVFLNSRHRSIKFTIEKEKDQKLPFLDVLITKTPTSRITTNYKKPTDTGLLTNYLSFTPSKYKFGLVKTLIDRLYKINNTWLGFHNDIEKCKTTLQKNLFPPKLIDQILKNYLSEKLNTEQQKQKQETRYFKLPYIGFFSKHTKEKVQNIIKKVCNDNVNVNIIFTPYKVCNMFSSKDKIPSFLKSMVVYKFVCSSCNACYVGETTRHLPTRIHEHFKTDKKSHIYKHLFSNENCFNSCTNECFSILDYASTKYQLKIKEALYIKWLDPILNKQKKTMKITLCV